MIKDTLAWSAAIGTKPIMYYNFQIFYPEIYILIILSLAVWVNLLFVRNNNITKVLLISFVLYSVLGAMSPKLVRWGYHIFCINFFLLIQAIYLFRSYCLSRPSLKIHRVVLSFILLIVFLPFSAKAYIKEKDGLKERYASEINVQVAAGQWLKPIIQQSSKICIIKHSDWQMPGELQSQFTYIFDFNYLDEQEFLHYVFPDQSEIITQCNAVMINTYHYDMFYNSFKNVGRGEDYLRFIESIQDVAKMQRVFSYGNSYINVYVLENHEFDE